MEGLKLQLKKKSMTLSDLASIFGVSSNTVWRWSSGNADPGLIVLGRLKEIFSCTYDDLLDPPDRLGAERNDEMPPENARNPLFEARELHEANLAFKEIGETELILEVATDGRIGDSEMRARAERLRDALNAALT